MKTTLAIKAHSMLAVPALVVSMVVAPGALHGQTAPATVQGHITDAIGSPVKVGVVKLTTDINGGKDRKYQYTFNVDGNGDFKGGGVAPGDYFIGYYNEDKLIDYFSPITIKGGQALTENFDMQRPEYLKTMTKEQLALLEETKKKNAAANEYNGKVKDLNKLMQQARDDSKAGNNAQAIKEMQDAIAIKPDEGLLYVALGEAQIADANKDAAAARAAKTSPMDVAIVNKYQMAAASYQKGIDMVKASKKPDPNIVALGYLNLGEAEAKSGKIAETQAAYDNAAQTDPKRAPTAYYNEAANFFNSGHNDEAAAAADKGIAVDPKKADLYYIKAQALIPKATVDPKTQAYVLPPGCLEAYQEYLELAPTGAHASEVTALLTGLKQPIKNSYKKGRG